MKIWGSHLDTLSMCPSVGFMDSWISMDACLQDEKYKMKHLISERGCVLNYWIHMDEWISSLIRMSHLEKLCVQSFDIWIAGCM